MSLARQIQALVSKEFRLEFRNRSSISSMLLYVVSTIFVCYQAFQTLEDLYIWNALLWIIILFASVNAVNHSFYHESRSQQMYYYLIARPEAIILAKMIYNMVLIGTLSLVSFIVYGLVLGNLVPDRMHFLLVLLLGSTGMAALLTLVAAIASKTNNNVGLIAILGLPLLVPLLITVIAGSRHAAEGMTISSNLRYLGALLGLDGLIIALGYILFPYLWKE